MILPAAQFAKIWRVMSLKEKALGLSAIILPALNKVALLGSFGLAIKLIAASAKGQIEAEWRWSITLGIVFAFILAGMIRWATDRIAIAIDISSVRIARRIMAGNLMTARSLPKKERRKVARKFKRAEAGIVRKWSTIMINLVDLTASLVIIAVLMSLVTWVLPLIGIIMMAGGMIVLLYFCFRIKRAKANPPLKEAQTELQGIVDRVVGGIKNPDRFIHNYENNRYDKLRLRQTKEVRLLKSKLSWLVSGGAAIMMAAVFYLASDGWLEGKDPILLLLFAFALRFSMLQSESVFLKWTLLLRERDAASLLSRVLRGDPGYIGSETFTIDLSPSVEAPQLETAE